MTPYITNQHQTAENKPDGISRLFSDPILERSGDSGLREINLAGEINPASALIAAKKMLQYENENPGTPIHLFLFSGGGCIVSGLMLVDTMRHLTSPVFTYAMGYAASMAAVLLAAGERGHRYILPHSRVMIHQASGSAGGTMDNLRATLAFQSALEADAERVLAETTGHTIEEIRQASRIDNWMDAKASQSFGLVDHIIEPATVKGSAR